MLHSVGCPQQSAESFVRNWNNASSSRACVHAFIDGSTGKVYQTLPWDHRAWHCGGSGNDTHIGVEMCEPSCIHYTGGASFSCSDKDAALAVVKRTYKAAVELFAKLCKEYNLNPMGAGVIVSHKEGHDRGIASGHGDPDHLWNGLNAGYTMDGFRRDVKEAMGGKKASDKEKDKAKPQAAKTKGGQISPGDHVKLKEKATYYDGSAIPDWVFDEVWIVKSVSGDRAVLDENTDHSKGICSPVSTKFLVKK